MKCFMGPTINRHERCTLHDLPISANQTQLLKAFEYELP